MARWITGIIMAFVAVILLLYAPESYLKILVVLLALGACWEFLSVAVGNVLYLKILGLLLTFFGVGQFVLFYQDHFFEFFVFVVIFVSFVAQFPAKVDNHERIRRTAFFALAIFYTSFLFGILGLITDQPNFRFWLFLMIACTYLGDTGAYVIGKSFGRHKLAKMLSPGKTIEGALGSLMGGVLGAFLVRQLFWTDFNIVLTIVLGLGLALLGLLGDLSESLLKRGFDVKDSGSLIPGHGGLLDRFDSVLFTGPVVYFVSLYV